ncbi:LysR family transcriptional regulator [Paroceanicella profunda]|uniref:LysR family transcriptional regulator n=1 Tax=Paroceanicella profunda TaxID=2579971 RepID=A0A5B8FWK0_9RHOB|nr:LysR family transcriptional regulator [Paroceanicella profunda]QDL93246.1 LysR family transcriptional regulator [Paroceanicella profunda]
MDNRFGEMSVFVRVVESGSFSAAARQLRMAPSTVSKLVARMEDRLGLRLLDRSTRKLALTGEGRHYFERCTGILADIDALEGSLARDAGQAGGTVRVSSSVAFGSLGIEPLLPAFWARHPGIRVDLSLSDDIVDLYLDRTDVAFRIGPLADSALTALRLGATERRIVAAPGYLAARGTPERIEDLDRHNCLGFNFRRARPVWELREGVRETVRVGRGSLLANNGDTIRRLALAGAGLGRLAEFHVRADLASGALVEVLPRCGRDTEDIHAVFLGGLHMPQRLRLFLDFMTPRLRAFVAGSG